MPLNINFQQILLHLLNFVLLFAILYFVLYKPVKKFMAKREQYYKDMDNQANVALSDAETMRSDYEKKIKAVDSEIEERRAEAAAEMAKSADRQRQQAKEEAEEIIAKAKKNAEGERDKIISEAQKAIADMATEAAGKIVFGDTSDAFDSFLSAAEESGKNE